VLPLHQYVQYIYWNKDWNKVFDWKGIRSLITHSLMVMNTYVTWRQYELSKCLGVNTKSWHLSLYFRGLIIKILSIWNQIKERKLWSESGTRTYALMGSECTGMFCNIKTRIHGYIWSSKLMKARKFNNCTYSLLFVPLSCSILQLWFCSASLQPYSARGGRLKTQM
jgi:hypothetical protein